MKNLLFLLLLVNSFAHTGSDSEWDSSSNSDFTDSEDEQELILPCALFGGSQIKKVVLNLLSRSKAVQYAMYRMSEPDIVTALQSITDEHGEEAVTGIVDRKAANKQEWETSISSKRHEKTATSSEKNITYMDKLNDLDCKKKNEILDGIIMHNKFAIFTLEDGRQIVGTGSCHWNRPAMKNDYESYVLLDDSEATKKYLKQFSNLSRAADSRTDITCTGQRNIQGHLNKPKVYFSPGTTTMMQVIASLVQKEQKAVRIATEVFTHWDVADALGSMAKKIRKHSRVLVNRDYANKECEALNWLITQKIPVYTNKKGCMHHKFIVFEENVESKTVVVVGSHNLTGQANIYNYENSVILEGAVAQQFLDEFDRILDEQADHIKKIDKKIDVATTGKRTRRINGYPHKTIEDKKLAQTLWENSAEGQRCIEQSKDNMLENIYTGSSSRQSAEKQRIADETKDLLENLRLNDLDMTFY